MQVKQVDASETSTSKCDKLGEFEQVSINYLKAAIKTAIDEYLASHPKITRDEITEALLGVANEYIKVWDPVRNKIAEELSFLLAIEMDYKGLSGKIEIDD